MCARALNFGTTILLRWNFLLRRPQMLLIQNSGLALAAIGPRLCKLEAVTPELKIAINSTPTHFFGTRYPIECQKVSYTLYIVSKSVIYALYSVKKCLIHSISCYFQSWCFSLSGTAPGRARRRRRGAQPCCAGASPRPRSSAALALVCF